jgi:hypothetical protein
MKPFAKLVHKTSASYLPTAFPAHYYGMPNGKIFLVYSRFYEVAFGQSGLEFVFAEHKDFSYDYENEKIVPARRKLKESPVFAEQVDFPQAKINVLSINRELQSYGEAQVFLNKEASKMRQLA